VLDAEINRLLGLGIEVQCGQAIATPEALSALRAKFDAVYLALGARRTKRLAQLDSSQAWWMDGAAYLAACNQGRPPALGRRVVVVGGGSAALDAARSARRAGHAVTILALETEHEMPAQREEVVEALEEGIGLVAGAMLVSAADLGAIGLNLTCVRVQLQRAAERGAFTVAQQPGSEFEIAADAVVVSIGQDPDLATLAAGFDTVGPVLAIDAFGATSVDRVWAGGDVASGARFVSEAIAMGERAALAIDHRLRVGALAPAGPAAGLGRATPEAFDGRVATVNLAAINLHYHPAAARAQAPCLGVAERLADGGEVQLGLALAQARAEAARCYSCGTCTHCDNCVTYCPDLAVQRQGAGYQVLGDYCKGCGVCVKECPSGSMKMLEELR
jgi:NADPH-dependent glutamate synthase beta subunit-like oxidoreductase